jgi:transcriptional regulator of acetoin/glycerol metabolism
LREQSESQAKESQFSSDKQQIMALEDSEDLRITTVERKAYERALLKTDGNKSKMARILGVSKCTVYTKLKKFGIS